MSCSHARYSAAVRARRGVDSRSMTGDEAVLIKPTALLNAPVSSRLEIK